MATTQITDHASLVSVVGSWLERSDIDDEIGNMIRAAEEMLEMDERCRKLDQIRYEIIAGQEDVPNGLIEVETMSYFGSSYFGDLEQVDMGMLNQLKGRHGQTGVPQYFAVVNDHFWFAPEPDNGPERATGVLTFSGNPSNGDSVTIGSQTYTFKTSIANADDILIGANVAESLLALAYAINDAGGGGVLYDGDTVENVDVYAEEDGVDTLTVYAKESGLLGNYIATTESSTALSWDAATMSGGDDPDDPYVVRLTYWKDIEQPLSEGTNWLVEDYPYIYLWATLAQSPEFLMEWERVAVWQNKLEQNLERLHKYQQRKQFSGKLVRRPRTIGE